MILDFLLKKRYKVVSASEIESRDVTSGFSKRNINKKQIAIIGGKKMQYTQNLIVVRNELYKNIQVFVKHKIKRNKQSKKLTSLVLIPKKKGDTVWF
ncbi:hypothetical protein [Lutibacter maritimus]|uniref:Uncharacterized protein n=1 Tax=Lutibacter maritimus TaxID=593133 RepID=A0A1I6NS15_9FLAO|nr:hypothetical protein [Lutibacter maritimus]SFS30665.1 hypothetical protein SAMN04488006_0468 [Lutibacter maritimus]